MLTPQEPKPLGKWHRRAIVGFMVVWAAVMIPFVVLVWVLTYRLVFRLPL